MKRLDNKKTFKRPSKKPWELSITTTFLNITLKSGSLEPNFEENVNDNFHFHSSFSQTQLMVCKRELNAKSHTHKYLQFPQDTAQWCAKQNLNRIQLGMNVSAKTIRGTCQMWLTSLANIFLITFPELRVCYLDFFILCMRE